MYFTSCFFTIFFFFSKTNINKSRIFLLLLIVVMTECEHCVTWHGFLVRRCVAVKPNTSSFTYTFKYKMPLWCFNTILIYEKNIYCSEKSVPSIAVLGACKYSENAVCLQWFLFTWRVSIMPSFHGLNRGAFSIQSFLCGQWGGAVGCDGGLWPI